MGDQPEHAEFADPPEMPESKDTSFQTWALGIIGALVVIGIGSGIGMAVASSGHFARLDTIIEIQSKQHEEDKGKLDRISESIERLPKLETITPQFAAMNTAISVNTQSTRANDDKISALAAVVHDNRTSSDSKYESLQSELKIYGARQWGSYNMDRWISAAEKKLGKPLPSVQDVTGKEPGQP